MRRVFSEGTNMSACRGHLSRDMSWGAASERVLLVSPGTRHPVCTMTPEVMGQMMADMVSGASSLTGCVGGCGHGRVRGESIWPGTRHVNITHVMQGV